MDVPELLRRMRAVYGSARSYSDEGELRLVFLSPTEGRHIAHAGFATFFVRPTLFNMTYAEGIPDPPDNPWPRTSFTITRTGSYSQVSCRGRVEEHSLRLALAKFTGVAHGVPCIIPGLLMTDEWKGPFLGGTLEDGVLDDEECEGIRCLRIRATTDRSEFTVWLDAETLLVRKIFERTRFDRSRKELEAEVQDRRLRAIGIPDSVRPPFKRARAYEPFVTEQTTFYKPRLNPRLNRAHFRQL